MKKITQHIFSIGALALLSTSCYNDNKEEIYQNIATAPICDTANVTYSATISKIAIDNCATSGCHVGSSPQSGLDLSTYNHLMTIANDGRLIARITSSSNPMPPTGSLSACEIEQITIWTNAGAQNN